MSLLIFYITLVYSIRFRSSKYCLSQRQLLTNKPVDTTLINSVTWDIKYHFSSRKSPVNPFFNVFYPENDLACLTFRTRFNKGRGSFDIACGFSECRVAQFVVNTFDHELQLLPYFDDESCETIQGGNEIRIIDGDFEEYLLIYGCYFRGSDKIEGAYLLTRPGTNFSIKFYRKILRPVLLVTSMRNMIIPGLDFSAGCNCTDHCSYYDLKGACNKNVNQIFEPLKYNFVCDLAVGVVFGLLTVLAVIICWYCLKRNLSNNNKND